MRGIEYEKCLTLGNEEGLQVRRLKAGLDVLSPAEINYLLTSFEGHIDQAGSLPGPRRELDVPLDNFMMNLFRIRLSLDE